MPINLENHDAFKHGVLRAYTQCLLITNKGLPVRGIHRDIGFVDVISIGPLLKMGPALLPDDILEPVILWSPENAPFCGQYRCTGLTQQLPGPLLAEKLQVTITIADSRQLLEAEIGVHGKTGGTVQTSNWQRLACSALLWQWPGCVKKDHCSE